MSESIDRKSNNEVLDRKPNPVKKKSGLVFWLMLSVLTLFLIYVGWSSEKKKSNDGLPTINANHEIEFTPGNKRPNPPNATLPQQGQISNKSGAVSNSSIQDDKDKKNVNPQPMTQEEKMTYLRQRSPLLIQNGSTLRAVNASDSKPQAVKKEEDSFIRDQYGAVIGVKQSPAQASNNILSAPLPGNYPSQDGNRNEMFFDKVSRSGVRTVQATPARDMQYRVAEGKLISGVLETAVNSDLPGRIRAMIDEDVYGEQGRVILLPRMTRLIGEYNSTVQNGQTRIFIIWRRALRPDGSSIDLDSYGTDSLGRSGIAGEVDNHFMRRFGTAILLSIMGGAVTELKTSGDGNGDTASSLYRLEVARAVQNQASEVLRNDMKIPPTIHIDQGTRIKVFVAQDLDFGQAAATRFAGFSG